jgi:hypothetical protein
VIKDGAMTVGIRDLGGRSSMTVAIGGRNVATRTGLVIVIQIRNVEVFVG